MNVLRRGYEQTWGRVFAAFYDRSLAGTEKAGLGSMRQQLLGQAKGDTLEIGAGTGLNLNYYTDQVGTLTLAEPEPAMAGRLRDKLATRVTGQYSLPDSIEVITAPGENLGVPGSSIDTVVSTLVLCTVADPAKTLAEISRVLKPGGQLLFLEHVRSSDPGTARWQDRLHGPWKAVGYGCNCNRDTASAIDASLLKIDEIEHGELPKAPPIVRPLVRGRAVLTA